MKALYFVGDKQMELRDIPMPVRKPNQYLIQIKATGICGSDFEGYMGKTGRRLAPMIMGHEFSGVIAEAPDGGKFKVGENVVIFPKAYCGTCEYCKQGLVNLCPNGLCLGVMDYNGSMTDYIVQDEKYIIPFKKSISFNIAAVTEPLAVAYRAVYKISDEEIQKANYILVVGAGTIGLLALAVLKARGAKNVIVSDATDFRLSIAKKMKADFTVNPATENFLAKIKEITGDKLCDFSVEAVGISPTAASSIDALRIGGTAIWIGNAKKMVEINMQEIVTRELSIRGNYVYDFNAFTESLKLLENNIIDVTPIITNVYPLEKGVEAFKSLENNKEGKLLKVILVS